MSFFAICLFVCCFSAAINAQSSTNNFTNDLAELKTFFFNGTEELQYSNDRMNILLLGPTGVGKTTLSLLLTSNNRELISTDIIEGKHTASYYIEDEYGLIGFGNDSEIYVPVLYVDRFNNNNLYDCPGFDGSKNVTIDDASMFFIHDVIKSSEYIKLIFLTTYSTVNIHGSGDDFLKLAKKVTELVQNIEQYQNAISMVITKDGRSDLSDSSLLETVVLYLQQVREALINGEISPEPYHVDAIKFIDILLTQKDGVYEKLAFFRSPEKPGPLSEIQRIQDSKEAISTMIYNNTQYIKVNITDFGYPISTDARNNIYALTETANKEIMENIGIFGEQIKQYYVQRENESVTLSSLVNMYEAASERFNYLDQELNTINTPVQFLKSVIASVNDLNVIISDKLHADLRFDIEFLNFLQYVNNGSDTNAIEWMNALDVMNYIKNSNNYYIFLSKIYHDLSEYKYQNDTKLYNVQDLNDWGLPNKPEGINITKNNFNLFADKTGYPEYKNLILDDIKLERLNEILGWTLRNPIEFKCSFAKAELIALGENIKISDVVKNKCYKASALNIRIYAVNTIFMDADLDLIRYGATLSIIAPKWNVMGKRKIKLGGTNLDIGKFPDLFGENTKNFFGYGNIDNLQDLQILEHSEQAIFDKFDSINDYYRYCRSKLSEGLRVDEIVDALVTMANKTLPIYNTIGFVKDLTGLEFQHYEKPVDTTRFYESLARRIEEYSKNIIPSENTVDYKLVLNYLYSAAASKVISLKRKFEYHLIIDIKTYVDSIYNTISRYESRKKEQIVAMNQKNYKLELDDKINTAISLIVEQIQPEIERIFDELLVNIEKLAKEVKELQEATQANIDELKRKRDELKRTMVLRAVFGALKVLGNFLGFLGPKGAAVGAVINSATSVAEGLFIKNITAPPQKPALPAGVKNDIDKYYNGLKEERQYYLGNVEDAVTNAITTVQQVQRSGSVDSAITNYIGKMNSLNTEIKKARAEDSVEVLIYRQFCNRAEIIVAETKVAIDTSRSKTNVTTALDNTSKGLNIISSGVNIYNAYKRDEALLNQYNDAIKAEEEKLQQLQAYEKMIYDTMIPMIKDLRADIILISDHWNGQTFAELEISKWQTQSFIKDMQLEMNKATEGFGVQPDISHCFDKLNEALTTMSNIYMRIESYKEHQKLVAYLTNVMHIEASSITVSNPTLQSYIDTIDIITDVNIIMDEFTQATSAFQQYVFPFASKYLDKYRLPIQMNGSNMTDIVIQDAKRKLDDIKDTLNKDSSTIDPNVDPYIHFETFENTNITKPFYIWQNLDYVDTITRLLNGTTVTFEANVRNSRYNAVKFTGIDLYFRINNNELQTQLNNDLDKCYAIEITHLGNSYYKCDSLYYIISNSAQHITYTIKRNNNGKPISANNVYHKLQRGDHMLSPYTLWNMTLVNRCENDIPNLLKYKNEVNLELIGNGTYVTGSSNCNSNLDYYYQEADLYIPTNETQSRSQPIYERKYKFEATGEYGSWHYTPILS